MEEITNSNTWLYTEFISYTKSYLLVILYARFHNTKTYRLLNKMKSKTNRQVPVVHACNPSTQKAEIRRIMVQRQLQGSSS
jgi:hypothetical protein